MREKRYRIIYDIRISIDIQKYSMLGKVYDTRLTKLVQQLHLILKMLSLALFIC